MNTLVKLILSAAGVLAAAAQGMRFAAIAGPAAATGYAAAVPQVLAGLVPFLVFAALLGSSVWLVIGIALVEMLGLASQMAYAVLVDPSLTVNPLHYALAGIAAAAGLLGMAALHRLVSKRDVYNLSVFGLAAFLAISFAAQRNWLRLFGVQFQLTAVATVLVILAVSSLLADGTEAGVTLARMAAVLAVSGLLYVKTNELAPFLVLCAAVVVTVGVYKYENLLPIVCGVAVVGIGVSVGFRICFAASQLESHNAITALLANLYNKFADRYAMVIAADAQALKQMDLGQQMINAHNTLLTANLVGSSEYSLYYVHALPVSDSDFIFSCLLAMFGLLPACMAVFGSYGLLLCCGLRSRSRPDGGLYQPAGLCALMVVFLTAAVSVNNALGGIPTGIAIPFFGNGSGIMFITAALIGFAAYRPKGEV